MALTGPLFYDGGDEAKENERLVSFQGRLQRVPQGGEKREASGEETK